MINKIFNIKVFLFLIFLFLFGFNFKASAQNQVNNQYGLSVSPSFFVINNEDLGTEKVIRITNSTNSPVKISATEIKVINSNDNSTIKQNPGNLKMLEISEPVFEVLENNYKDIFVLVNENANSYGGFPAISFKTSPSSGSSISTQTEIVSVFLLQELDGKIGIQSKIETFIPNISFESTKNITGNIENIGDKFFNPSGSVAIYKDGIFVAKNQLTTQVEGFLFSGDQKSFSYNWEVNKNEINKPGNYKLVFEFNTDPFNQSTLTEVNFFYLPSWSIALATIILFIFGTSFVFVFVFKSKISKWINKVIKK